MTARPQISGRPGARVGVPLARAQRLSRKAAPPRRAGRRGGVAALMVGSLLGFVGMAYTADDPAGQTLIHAAVPSGAAPQTVWRDAAGGAPFADLPVLAASEVPTSTPVCVSVVTNRLAALYAATRAGHPAAALGDGLETLVRAAGACPDTTLRVEGSLELALTPLAAARVRWSSPAQRLHVAVIDAIPPGEVPAASFVAGVPVEFILH